MNALAEPPNKPTPGMTVLALPSAALRMLAGKFPEGVNVLVVPPSALQPEFIRPPKAGEICPVTGLPRTTFLELLEQAGTKKIPVRYLRKPGATTGIKLVPRQPLIDYINSLPSPDGGEGEE
jgi:hypothetical protein